MEGLNTFAAIMLFAWNALALGLFAIYPPRKAAIMTALGGLLFLPVMGTHVEGIPAYGKIEAIGISVLLATAVFNSRALLAFRPHWIDLPMLVCCLTPFASSITNDQTTYDGLSAVAQQTLRWGMPYFIGRIYITDWEAARELAVGIFVAGLIYIPFCIFENRMSPKLHLLVYGKIAGGFEEYEGFGILGWRPSVFMQTSLQVTLFMGIASMIGLWMWITGALRSLWGWRMWWLVPPLMLTTVLTKTIGGNVLWIAGVLALLAARQFGTRLALMALLAFTPTYVVLRGTGLWDAQVLLDVVQSNVTARRFESFKTRITNENLLAAKARERPAVGWARWGRSRILDSRDRDISVTDGLWIIAFGETGWIGLGSLFLAMLLPAGFVLWQARPPVWRDPRAAGVVTLAVVLMLYMIDNLFNAMLNPIWVLPAGGLGTMWAAARYQLPGRAGYRSGFRPQVRA